MIIAAAESTGANGSSGTLSHIKSRENNMMIPGLQPSCSSTTTTSSNSSIVNDPTGLYDESYTQFMNNNNTNEMMMIDQMTK